MNWHQFVTWTDTTAMPEGDVWESLREGLIKECHEALVVYHQVKAIEHGAVKRLYRDGAPDWRKVELRKTQLDRLYQRLIEEVGDACWYAARIVRLAGSNYSVLVGTDAPWSRLELTRMLDEPRVGEVDGDYWAVDLLAHLLCATGINLAGALANNEVKLLARKAAGTIQGEGER